jgi:hypothetical protein
VSNRSAKPTTAHKRQGGTRDPQQILEKWTGGFYGGTGISDEFVLTAISIYRANKGRTDLEKAVKGSSADVIARIDILEATLTNFLDSKQSHAFIRLLKDLRPILQPILKSSLVPPALRRYDLATLWADLPTLLKTFHGLLAAQRDSLHLLPAADKKRVRNRALIWLFLAIRRFSISETDACEDIGRVIYPEEQDLQARGAKPIFDHLRWFRNDHLNEYEQIEQYLQHNPCPSRNELLLMVFFGVPYSAKPLGEERHFEN